MLTVTERAAISRAYSAAAGECFNQVRIKLIRVRALMLAAGILQKAAREMRVFAAAVK